MHGVFVYRGSLQNVKSKNKLNKTNSLFNQEGYAKSCLMVFFQVSEWIVHVIISQGTRSGRRSVLNCLLRLAQVSWNIGNLNGVMEILIGLR
jgi:hypothetical protein